MTVVVADIVILLSLRDVGALEKGVNLVHAQVRIILYVHLYEQDMYVDENAILSHPAFFYAQVLVQLQFTQVLIACNVQRIVSLLRRL